MLPVSIAPLLGLTASLAWGASDFCGGLSAKRSSVWWVVLGSQAVGIVFLTLLALLFREALPAGPVLLLGALAGLLGEFGLIMLYQGLAIGRMGVVAPLSAVFSAILPALFGMFQEGLPSGLQLGGIGLALPAIWLVSASGHSGRAKANELFLGLGAGLAFGVYFILIGQVSSHAVFWPLASARLASLIFLSVVVWFIKPVPLPTLKELPLIAATGVLDSSGNLFFALATRYGRLDLASVLASLYPAATVMLAYWLLHERLAGLQWLGVALALLAIVFISI